TASVRFNAPVLLTATLPPPDSLMAFSASVVVVLISEMSFEPVLVASKLPTVFAPSRVVPPADLVDSGPVVLTSVLQLSPIAPLAVKLTAPSAASVPVRLSAPVLLIATLPPPDSPMPVSVSVPAALVSDTSPDVMLVALKLPTVFALLRVVPPTDVVDSVPIVLTAADPLSLMAPLDCSVTVPPLVLVRFWLTVSAAAVASSVSAPVVVIVPPSGAIVPPVALRLASA